MAIKIETEFPGKSNAGDADYPQGSHRDITAPGDGLGTPRTARGQNDTQGLLQKLLDVASITPSGSPDTVLASDYFDGLMTVVSRPTLTVATMTAIVGVKAGQVFNVKEYSTGNGGGGFWTSITTGITAGVDLPNGIDIVVGVADALISFVLIKFKVNEFVARFGIITDGATDGRAALARMDDLGLSITLTGPVSVQSALTLTHVIAEHGGSLKPANTIKVTITENYESPQQVMFDYSAGGLFDLSLSDRNFNISHFSGASLNDKWDNLRSGGTLVDSRKYTLDIPVPLSNEEGAIDKSGGSNNWHWDVDGSIDIDDPENFGDWYWSGELLITSNLTDLFTFGPTNKTENVHFFGKLRAETDGVATVTNGLAWRGCVRFSCEYLSIGPGFVNPFLATGENIATSDITVSEFHGGGWSGAMVKVDNTSNSVASITIPRLIGQLATVATAKLVDLIGNMREINIGSEVFTYTVGTGAILNEAVTIENNSNGALVRGGQFGLGFFDGALKGVVIRDTTAGVGVKTEGIIFKGINPGGAGTNDAFDIDFCNDIKIENTIAGFDILVGADARRTVINAQVEADIVDSGIATSINNLSRGAHGAGNPPPTGTYPIGRNVVNTADDTLWKKTQDTGVSADDFIQLTENWSATDAELNAVADTINTNQKYAGKKTFASTGAIPVYAASSAAGGVWKKFSDDTTNNTPV